MEIILSHQNLDFDGLASIVAAKKLNPSAVAAIAFTQSPDVQAYLDLYIDSFSLVNYKQVNWETVKSILFVDTSSTKRAGIDHLVHKDVHMEYLDHHTQAEAGANITLFVSKLRSKNIDISPMEATLFGLGLYSDTGCFSFPTTHAADLQAAAYLLEKGMDLTIVTSYLHQPVAKNPLFEPLLSALKVKTINGQSIGISTCVHPTYVAGVSAVVEELHSLYQLDATIICCQLSKHTYIIGRARPSVIDLNQLFALFEGGGHPQAASAQIKNQQLDIVYQQLQTALPNHIISDPLVTTIMTWPVQTVYDTDLIEEAWTQLLKNGHSSFPVVDELQTMVGIISKADLIKAKQLGHEHSPVEAVMKTKVITLAQTDTIKMAHEKLAHHHIGRLPVIDEKNKVVGIVTRTNLIQQSFFEPSLVPPTTIEAYFGSTYQLLKSIGFIADELRQSVFLVGGVVRDLFMQKKHTDLDLTVEGDAIAFAEELAVRFGGSVKAYHSFFSATWSTPSGKEIDVASCRKEYYKSPGALPDVHKTSIYEDLARRDFTINAVALFINQSRFGELVDLYNGQEDINSRHIRILYPLSFVEDPTRIFRAVRFSLRLAFTLDLNTRKAAKAVGSAIKQISPQRVLQELTKYENEDMLLAGFQALEDLDVWYSLFQKRLTAKATQFMQSLEKHHLKKAPFFLLAFAYETNCLNEVSRFFITKKDQQLLKEITAIIEHHHTADSLNQMHLTFKTFSGDALLFYGLANSAEKKLILNYLEKRSHLDPLLTGNDLIELGYQPGPHFSEWLVDIEGMQLEGQIRSKEDAIAWLNSLT
ncbi:tRNA nucleotidyltransferase [Bacillus sp. JCM 19046]|nr:tRNA nucleotidyltransferase [Bacillus sp. JCM 19045]GAF19423.1 tRNA nucleotidyltransferase [Bacillus sp. JCM 19046]